MFRIVYLFKADFECNFVWNLKPGILALYIQEMARTEIPVFLLCKIKDDQMFLKKNFDYEIGCCEAPNN